MKNIVLANRYAKALFDVAVERNVLETVLKDMALINDICKESPDLLQMLRSPVIYPDIKQKILEIIFSSNISKESLLFLRLISTKRRGGYIPEICSEFIEIYKEYKNIKTAYFKTAYPAEDELKHTVMNLLKQQLGSDIDLVSVVDPSIIGGFILTVDDKQYNASIQNKINELSKEFSVNHYKKNY